MDEAEPIGVEGPEGHVGPHVGVHAMGRGEEGDQDHAQGVRHRAVERVEELGVREPVVRLVRRTVELFLRDMHSRAKHATRARTHERAHGTERGFEKGAYAGKGYGRLSAPPASLLITKGTEHQGGGGRTFV